MIYKNIHHATHGIFTNDQQQSLYIFVFPYTEYSQNTITMNDFVLSP